MTGSGLGAGEALVAVVRRAVGARVAGVVVALVVASAYFGVKEPLFLTWQNWQNIVRVESVVAILAIGMTFVILTGAFDLSVASATAAAAMIFGLALQEGWDWRVAAVATLAVGVAMGLLNGLLIGVGKIPFFVVTLGTLAIFQSFALLVTPGGAAISLFGLEGFASVTGLVTGSVGPVPTPFLILGAFYAAGTVVLRLTVLGRYVYAVGSSPEAARLAGVPVTLITVAVFAISGLLAGAAGIVQTGMLSGAAPLADATLMLTVVAAVLIGGTAFTGGEGGLLGTIVGVLFLGVISNGLALTGVSEFWRGLVSGLILIAAVAIGVVRTYGWRLPSLWRRRTV